MKFIVNQHDLQKSLNYCQGVIEKRSTLPILSNILLNVSNSKLTIIATDLDLIFVHEITDIKIQEIVEKLLDSEPKPIIILQSDHGVRFQLNEKDEQPLDHSFCQQYIKSHLPGHEYRMDR